MYKNQCIVPIIKMVSSFGIINYELTKISK